MHAAHHRREDGSRAPFQISPAREIYATFSPDGRFVAYSSDASGQREIDVELFGATVGRGRSFDVHPTSGRFIMVDKTIDSPPRFVNVVTNVFELIER